MAGARDRVAMTQAEVAGFLADHLKVQVATVGGDGAPHLSTLFYVADDGVVSFWTYGRSQKVVNLRRDPRVSALVEDGTAYDELRGVSISGHVELVEEYDAVRRVGLLVAEAMHGAPLDGEERELAQAVVDQQARKRVVVRVIAEHVASWDHTKLG
ncbi:PPOX class F420-dependent enzyme [Marmoricola endophyticus]|uniref:PPOX class F420-dependent enzyme n=1 Tax=Marmoricola endophyticus TaxID=2040280 RepID=A0A917F0P2_9ACTN|nr:pyridoxamine 5'-phosphate oxidase family protein [Marmoricola endophyticus]GGF33144.1 PPOX class F420-dependent enzyme [Marmoricola endophyticus]